VKHKRVRKPVPRSSRPQPQTIQPRFCEAFRLIRAEYCRLKPAFRNVKAALRKAQAAGELGQRPPTFETVLIWSRGGLSVPNCWESEKSWAELAALVDSNSVTLQQLLDGTEAAEHARHIMAESLTDPAARAKLRRDPALLMKVLQLVSGDARAIPAPPHVAPAASEEDSDQRRLEDLTDEELDALLEKL